MSAETDPDTGEQDIKPIVQRFVFHKLVSEQGKKLVQTFPRHEAMSLPDEKVDLLTASILKSFNGEASIAFAGVEVDSWFETKTHKYLEAEVHPADNSVFFDYSLVLLEKLADKMEEVPFSTGGYLTIIDYTIEGCRHLMLVLIKDQKGIGINQSMELEEVVTLGTDKLHFAADIHIERWLSLSESGRERHVAFLKGKNRLDTVVGYFKSLLNIDEAQYHDPSKHTQQIVAAVKSYCETCKSEDDALAARRAIQDWAESQATKNLAITLSGVANLVEPDEPQKFIAYLKEKKLEIPAEFVPVQKFLKALMKYKIVGPKKQYTLSFEQTAIEEGVIFQNSNGNIEIADAPAATLKLIPIK
ncbi:nucleoid-associated protein [Pseudomonas weihenstephanensis]|uniref:Nucleoid-associated protein n=1 Tax=Pseudomonas weihenstephanensis TaxID=1608994 RepID=A0ABS1ZFB6_9PSED|nr:nucleoid-associated protein [Pseudomonas weihenstephanensis]MBM1195148.1 nucleoid-associated protein [Pseudomonas weihenstephanensis]